MATAAGLLLLACALVLAPNAPGQEGCFGASPTITGSGTIEGTDGDDVILGSDGNDAIQAKGGNDKVCGGGGDDNVGGGPGNDEVGGGAGNDDIHGGAGDDTVLGDEGDDALRGGPDNDVCDGGPGTNTAPTSGFEACETVRNAGAGAGEAPSQKLRAILNRRQEVPRPRRARRARGRFAATLTRTDGGFELRWRLTSRRLTGRRLAAHIHRGPRGTAGPVVIPLCGPCSRRERGTAQVTDQALARSIVMGETYVNVHTRKNPDGEIRGQITRVTE
jgi:CHRD domain/RTX calcium-binding nonapeptide repeat (4 copies)